MHHCLRVPEILSMIVDDVKSGGGTPTNSLASLAALAMTCKTFQDCALDALWSSQGDLVNLMRCLPSNCLSGRGQKRLVYFAAIDYF